MSLLDQPWRPAVARSVLGLAVLLATSACAAYPSTAQVSSPPAASAGSTVSSTSPEQSPSTTPSALPKGVVSRGEILSRFSSDRKGVSTQAKLVRLADLAKASDDSLTQCQFHGCRPGALVWLVLQSGPPFSFGHSSPSGYKPPADADAWTLFPVDAITGQGRGSSEIGPLSTFSTSVWTLLTDLAPGSPSDTVPVNASPDPSPTSGATTMAASPTTAEDCPPLATATGGAAMVDYVDFVQANDRFYLSATPSVTVAGGDLGAEQFRVRCSFSALNDRTHQMTPPARNGDAAFLPVGASVRAVQGWSPKCRLAARSRGAWTVYLAYLPNATTSTIDPCALAAPDGTAGHASRIAREPATVALDHCGVNDLLAAGTRWVALHPPFTALDPPTTFSGQGHITADGLGLTYTDDKGSIIHFTGGVSAPRPVCD